MQTATTETQRDAYHDQVVAKGIDKTFQRTITELMKKHPDGLTRREIGAALRLETNQYSARCNELITCNPPILQVAGKRKCSISNVTVEILKHSMFMDPANTQGDMFQ